MQALGDVRETDKKTLSMTLLQITETYLPTSLIISTTYRISSGSGLRTRLIRQLSSGLGAYLGLIKGREGSLATRGVSERHNEFELEPG